MLVSALVAYLGVVAQTHPSLIPLPNSVAWNSGSFSVDSRTRIVSSPDTTRVAQSLRSLLRATVPAGDSNTGGAIVLTLDSRSQELGDEGYRLKVTFQRIEATAQKPAGLFYAVQTLRQLLPAPSERRQIQGQSFAVLCVEIEDKPRFAWRGMHLDVSRHFFTPNEIKQYIDSLSMLKMNVFHWHLVDDGGWRIEIKKYPRLTSVGGFRIAFEPWDQRKLQFAELGSDSKLYGGFYTQDQIRDIVKYAQDRFVTIVPEIEMPGHTMPSISAYPNLACSNADAKAFFAEAGCLSPNVYCAGKESTFEFLENVLTEVMDLFPSPFIHIGGDEVDKSLWHACPDCQKRMHDEGLKDEQELQSYFVKRIEKFLNSKGRRLMGWDEILEGGLAPNAAVMSWRGEDGGIAAAKAGHDVVMTPTSPLYFDASYAENGVEKVFLYDPVPKELTEEQGRHVLGVQANVWTERIPTYARVEQMTMPRQLSVAEIGWVPRGVRSATEFEERVVAMYGRLVAMGIDVMLPTPVPDQQIAFLDGPTDVRFIGPTYEGLHLRYTMDGTAPTPRSPEYRGPIHVSSPTLVSAAFVAPNGRVGAITTVNCVPARQSDATRLEAGIVRDVYDVQATIVPDFTGLKSKSSTISDSIGLLATDGKENFAVHLEGVIKIPADGVYRFRLASDDGSWLKVQGVKLVDNDGVHAPGVAVGSARLKAGLYDFEIGYFQAGGAMSLGLEVQVPRADWQPLPASWLFHRG